MRLIILRILILIMFLVSENSIDTSYQDTNQDKTLQDILNVHPTNAEENVTTAQLESPVTDETPMKKGKKRIRQESEWKENVKKLRNSGKAYQSPKSGKIVPGRSLKPPCKDTCTFKCQVNITESQRHQLLAQYWALGSLKNNGHS
uniref:Uncharacterized protein LOC114330730 n=1 Tax=Diabrotica virgifera virgifera TaxID=50390 RepID=A0A6P7FT08_DIAVI